MTKLMLGTRAIGPREPVLVIAESGVNHDGSVARALELVELAAECGADAVKLQVFHAGALVHASCRLADYQQRAGAPRDPGTMLRKYELSTADLKRVVDRVRALKLLPIATPFSTTFEITMTYCRASGADAAAIGAQSSSPNWRLKRIRSSSPSDWPRNRSTR